MPSRKKAKPRDKELIKKRLQRSSAKDSAPSPSQQELAAISQRARLDPGLLTPSDVVQLQGVIGNRAIGELLGSSGQGPVIQRKVENLRIDKRLRRTYGSGSVNAKLEEIRGQIETYNAIPVTDGDYNHQLQHLETLGKSSLNYAKEVIDFEFLNKAGTLRSLGGPFRHSYHMLARNLRKLAGTAEYSQGQVDLEYRRVQEQAGEEPTGPEYIL
jgi:hypothetical protein